MVTKQGDEIIGIWFTEGEGFNWMATALARDGEIYFEHRVRIIRDDKVFDSKDEKLWRAYKAPIAACQVVLRFLDDAAFTFREHFPGCGPVFRFFGGTTEEAMAWLKLQPWAHVECLEAHRTQPVGERVEDRS